MGHLLVTPQLWTVWTTGMAAVLLGLMMTGCDLMDMSSSMSAQEHVEPEFAPMYFENHAPFAPLEGVGTSPVRPGEIGQPPGYALEFDGVSGIVELGLGISRRTTTFTVEMWVKGLPGQFDRRIFAEGSSSSRSFTPEDTRFQPARTEMQRIDGLSAELPPGVVMSPQSDLTPGLAPPPAGPGQRPGAPARGDYMTLPGFPDPLFAIGTASGGGTGQLSVYIRQAGGSVWVNHAVSAIEPFDGHWRHVAVVVDHDLLFMYVDGRQDPHVVRWNAQMLPVDTTSVGGIQREERSFLFEGSIREVRVWDTARTAEEIQEGMSRALEGDEEGLVGYWPFNEGSGIVAADLSRNGNDGILSGGVTWRFAFPFVSDVEDQIVANGEPVTFGPVEIFAPVGEVTYQWYKDDAPIPGAEGSAYTVANATPSDAGVYHVVVNDARDETPVTSSRAALEVGEPR